MEIIGSIPYQSLPFHNKLIKDYLAGNSLLREFYNKEASINGLLEAAKERQFEISSREKLADALLSQYGNLLEEGPVSNNIQKLRSANTVTITTGHQLCAYTGPSYLVYKIASIINLASNLNAYDPSMYFVPVFWMASEDHDFEEVSSVNFYGKSWKWEAHDESMGKIPVGLIPPREIASWAAEMKEYFRNEINVSSILDIFENSYKNSKSLSEATRKIFHHLFSDFGLVILDGNDKTLKAMFEGVMEKEINDKLSNEKVKKTTHLLKNLGYEGQINPRPVNLFYISENNYRERIDYADDNYTLNISGRVLHKDEIIQLLKKSPEKFSPNVVMRPMYQEVILPNIAYVGGPGETAYWLQLKAAFDSYKIQFPVLILRNSFVVLADTLFEKAAGFGLEWKDYFNLNIDEIINKFIAKNNSETLDFDIEEKAIASIINSLNEKANGTDTKLIIQIAMEGKIMMDNLDKIKSKFNKALKQKSENNVKGLQKFKLALYPYNSPQERVINYLDGIGADKNSVRDLVKMANPLENELKLLKK
jgi:bacillithiol biosynthesis cysteine-adding enzyme BshC